eukprot:PhM_4_TR16764/c1_g1_i8/m.75115
MRAVERNYITFRKYYGWKWKRYGATTFMQPSDIASRLRTWNKDMYFMHAVNKYDIVVFGDETAVYVEGDASGMSLVHVDHKNPKLMQCRLKECVTVFLAGYYDMRTKTCHRLPPLLVFKATAATRERSGVLNEVTEIACKLGGIMCDISTSGWVKADVFERYIQKACSFDTFLRTLIVVDVFGGHRVKEPEHDMVFIPGGCTSAVQVHDRIINPLFKRRYRELLFDHRRSQSYVYPPEPATQVVDAVGEFEPLTQPLGADITPITRSDLCSLVKQAHDSTWDKYDEAINKTVLKYIVGPATEFPWQ